MEEQRNKGNFRFLEWKVYKDAKALYKFVLLITKKLSREHQFSLGTQISRSSLSVVLNIAEGSGKHSDGDFRRYLSIAMGSLYETFAVIDIMRENGFITSREFNIAEEKIFEIGNQLGGFKKSLSK